MPLHQNISNELTNYFNLEKVNGTERIKIVAICNDIIDNAIFIDEIHNSMITITEEKDFKLESHLPALISAILRVIQSVEFYKEVREERIKFVIYCFLISSLFQFYPSTLKTVQIETLRNLYKNSIDLVLILPQTVKIAKKSCVSCLASNFKIFNRFNKGKIIIE